MNDLVVQQPDNNEIHEIDFDKGITEEDVNAVKSAEVIDLDDETVKGIISGIEETLKNPNTKKEMMKNLLSLLDSLLEKGKIDETKYSELKALVDANDTDKQKKSNEVSQEDLQVLKDGILVDVDNFKEGVSNEFDKIIGDMNGLENLFGKGTAEKKKEALLAEIVKFHDTIDKAATAKDVLQTLKDNISLMKLSIAKEHDKRATSLIAFVGTSIAGFDNTLSTNEKKYGLTLENTQIVENSNKEKSGVENTVRSFADSITGYLAAGKEVLNSMSDIIISVFDTLLTVCDMLWIDIRKYFPDAALAILDTLLKDKFGLSPKQNEYVKNLYEKYDINKEVDLKLAYNSMSADNKPAKVEIGYNKEAIGTSLKGELETLAKDQDVIDVDYTYIKGFESVHPKISELTVKDVEIQGTYGKKIIKKIDNTPENKEILDGFMDIFVASENVQGKVGELVQYSHKKGENDAEPKNPIIDAKGVCMAYGLILLKGDLARHTIGVNGLPNKKPDVPVNTAENTDTSDPVVKYGLTKEKISDGKYKLYYDAEKKIPLGGEWLEADLTDEKIKRKIKEHEEKLIKDDLDKPENRSEGADKKYAYMKKIFVADDFVSKLAGTDQITRYSYLATNIETYKTKTPQIKAFFAYLKTEKDTYKQDELNRVTGIEDTFVLANDSGVIVLKTDNATNNDSDENIKIEQGLGKYKNDNETSEVLIAGDYVYPLAGEKRAINRGYGYKFHPVYKKFMLHSGIDLYAKEGDDLYAIGKGKIIGKGFEDKRSSGGDGGGNYVVLEFENGKRVSYCHLQKESDKNIGDEVAKGDTIGFAGQTGDATGPHLHLTFKNKDLTSFDPLIEGSEFKELFEPTQQPLLA